MLRPRSIWLLVAAMLVLAASSVSAESIDQSSNAFWTYYTYADRDLCLNSYPQPIGWEIYYCDGRMETYGVTSTQRLAEYYTCSPQAQTYCEQYDVVLGQWYGWNYTPGRGCDCGIIR